ncbi:hybrid sensor histidine kinase/response regulator [Candidatus Cyanaurora vandensis]|uniref:hybrid sensor histidine kinase/response regulator n=1 Tax=Candidatus Cyanaurora vandensis TaxID=2714958 RepID=UPI00257D15F4|nr:hybrid sensor histidine kinase/response regulator [Candidatus Cyanaurora vandensis]
MLLSIGQRFQTEDKSGGMAPTPIRSPYPSETMMTQPDRILVVDDFPDNIALIEAILLQEGYEIDTATSGLEALQKIQAYPPALVMLDVMMPGLNGIETTRRLKAQKELGFIPVLLITASDKTNLVEGLDAGADEFIRKPLDHDDLLARVRSLLRLKHTLDERDFIARQREDFVSRLTHDLRTPLVAADRMLQLILDGALGDTSEDLDEALVTLRQSNQHLLTMTNSLLEIYRYDAGRKTLHFVDFDVEELFQEVYRQVRGLAEAKEIDLQLNFHSGVGIITADRLEVRRMLENLLGNALKFTDRGGQIVVETKPYYGGMQFAVSDNGPGVAPADLATLFDRFTQGKHFKGGTGLGLHHTRQIVEAHGGRVTVQSALGEGATFTVYLPARPGER